MNIIDAWLASDKNYDKGFSLYQKYGLGSLVHLFVKGESEYNKNLLEIELRKVRFKTDIPKFEETVEKPVKEQTHIVTYKAPEGPPPTHYEEIDNSKKVRTDYNLKRIKISQMLTNPDLDQEEAANLIDQAFEYRRLTRIETQRMSFLFNNPEKLPTDFKAPKDKKESINPDDVDIEQIETVEEVNRLINNCRRRRTITRKNIRILLKSKGKQKWKQIEKLLKTIEHNSAMKPLIIELNKRNDLLEKLLIKQKEFATI